ncbi:hypothetical protein K8I61_17135 [bacterium]|nr:hypothetical protein [bacterium]
MSNIMPDDGLIERWILVHGRTAYLRDPIAGNASFSTVAEELKISRRDVVRIAKNLMTIGLIEGVAQDLYRVGKGRIDDVNRSLDEATFLP